MSFYYPLRRYIMPDFIAIESEEDGLFFEDESDQQPPSDIVAYNELRSCADLFRMYDNGILEISPDFQRDSVWVTVHRDGVDSTNSSGNG